MKGYHKDKNMTKLFLIGLVGILTTIFIAPTAFSQGTSASTTVTPQTVNITTPPLTMTGMRPDEQPQQSDPTFQPVVITTEPLTMTGMSE
jgi:hypothetical protein